MKTAISPKQKKVRVPRVQKSCAYNEHRFMSVITETVTKDRNAWNGAASNSTYVHKMVMYCGNCGSVKKLKG